MKNKGISLLVLVITIIVMIIIAGAMILSLTNSNVINKSKEAIANSNLKAVKAAAALAYVDYKTSGETESVSEYIKNWLITKEYISEEEAEYYIFDESGYVISKSSLKQVNISSTSISQNNTYNDSAFIRINGKSEQNGTPSPDYPSTINSVENFDLISTNGMQAQTINFNGITLRSLPDGTKDYIEIDNVNKTAKLYRNVGITESIDSTGWSYRYDIGNADGYSRFSKTTPTPVFGIGTCSHFGTLRASITNSAEGFLFSETYSYFGIIIKNETINGVVGMNSSVALPLLNTWLQQQNTNGNKLTALYKLATPVITNLDYEEVKTYYPYTQIYTNAIVQPTLDAKIIVNK